MSDAQQLGQHPDADQISAFVEHALPAHERERVFAHLAICAECRELVRLSLPPIDDLEPAKDQSPAKPMPAPERRPWWSGWTLAWPAAAVLAGLSAFAIYMHQAGQAPAPAQIAGLREPAPTAAQADLPPAQPKQALRGAIANKAADVPTGSSGGRPAARSVQSLPIMGRNLDEFTESAPPGLQAKSRASAANPAAGSGAGMASGTGNGIAAEAGASPPATEAKAPQADALGRQPASAPPPLPAVAAKSPQAGNSQTVEVTAGASPIDSESTIAAGAVQSLEASRPAPFIPLKHSLPSGLAVLSIATHGRLMLAIDLHNAVFLSGDDGKHWRPIATPWQGRAVKAELVSYEPPGRAAYDLEKAAPAGGSQRGASSLSTSMNSPLAAPATAPGVSLAGMVTDPTGAMIGGATIEVIDAATHAARSVKTDASGRYVVDGLAPGTYTVRAAARGFEAASLPSVTIAAGSPAVADLRLNIGAATESVTVEAGSIATSAAPSQDRKDKRAVQPDLFVITTDNGDRWTSADGATWQHR